MVEPPGGAPSGDPAGSRGIRGLIGDDATPSRRWVKAVLIVVIALLVAMWVYAFFYAPTEGINRIGDRTWSARSQARCEQSGAGLIALRDVRPIKDVGADALNEKADIVVKTNVILTSMVDAVAADVPADAKGQEIVPKWIADYRTYLADRVDMVAQLRAGQNVVLSETQVKGAPISDFINDFARQNNMPACQTPDDLSV